jgi:hypothetical protein
MNKNWTNHPMKGRKKEKEDAELKEPRRFEGSMGELKESWGTEVGDLASMTQNVDVSNIGSGVTRDLSQSRGEIARASLSFQWGGEPLTVDWPLAAPAELNKGVSASETNYTCSLTFYAPP